MTRTWIRATLVVGFAAAMALYSAASGQAPRGGNSVPGGLTPFIKNDQLTTSDPTEISNSTKRRCKVYDYKLEAGNKYTITLVSDKFDTLLRMEDGGGKQVASDDKAGVAKMEKIVYTPFNTGTYKIIVTSFDANRTGPFKLQVTETPTTTGKLVFSKSGELKKTDPFDQIQSQRHFKSYNYKMEKGKTYTMNLTSPFDNYLFLEDSKGKLLKQDDDGGPGLNAKIVFVPKKTGDYQVVATSLGNRVTGGFTLTINDPTKKIGAPPVTFKGALTNNDPFYTINTKKHQKTYSFKLSAGTKYELQLLSKDYDSYLRVLDSAGKQVITADAVGVGKVDKVSFTPFKNDTYQFVCTSWDPLRTGSFVLRVSKDDSGAGKVLFTQNGQLTKNDPYDVRPTGKHYKSYQLALMAGKNYYLHMDSPAFDGYVYLMNDKDQVVASDGGGGPARTTYSPIANGKFTIIATTTDPGKTGPFNLSVTTQGKKALLQKKDELTAKDSHDVEKTDKHFKSYDYQMKAGKTYVISLTSPWDNYLYLLDSTGATVASDDDSGPRLNAKLTYKPKKNDNFKIIVTSFGAKVTGTFTMQITDPDKAGGAQPVTIKGKLTSATPFYVIKYPRKIYEFKMEANQPYFIIMSSPEYDPFLRLEDPSGKQVAVGTGGVKKDKLSYFASAAGKYKIIASTEQNGSTGPFELKVLSGISALSKKDKIDKSDPLYMEHSKKYRKVVAYELQAEQSYVIDLKSTQFDAFLRLENSKGKQVAFDDQSGGNNNARIKFTAPKTEKYRIIVSTYDSLRNGFYTLTISEGPKLQGKVLFNKSGQLQNSDPLDKTQSQRFFKHFKYKMEKGNSYVVELSSFAFNPILYVEDGEGELVGTDNYPAKASRRVIHAKSTGAYKLVATSSKDKATGAFSVKVLEAGNDPKSLVLKKKDKLVADGHYDSMPTKQHFKSYKLKMQANQKYRIEVKGAGLQTDVYVENKLGKQMAQQPAGKGATTQMTFTPPVTDEYKVVVTAFGNKKTGSYNIEVTQLGIPLAGVILKKDDKLTKADPFYRTPTKYPKKDFQQKLEGGKTYFVTMSTQQFPPYLRLEDAKGKIVKTSSQVGGPNMMTLVATPKNTATYTIIASTGQDNHTGAFSLTVKEATIGFNKAAALTNADPMYVIPSKKYSKRYPFDMKADQTYLINLKSQAFDAYLRVEDSKGIQVAFDDQSGGNNDAKLLFTPPASAEYQLVVTSFGQYQTGNFQLTVLESKPAFVKQESLTKQDDFDVLRTGKHYKSYPYKMLKDRPYVIELTSAAFDTYLRLQDSSGKTVKYNNNSGPGTKNSRIIFTPPATGVYKLVAASNLQNKTGAFTLAVYPIVATKKVFVVEGQLTKDDFFDPIFNNSHQVVYQVKLKSKTNYVIDLQSADFDPFLRLETNKRKRIAIDNNSGPGRKNARIILRPDDDGTYRIVVTSYNPGGLGSFSLKVLE